MKYFTMEELDEITREIIENPSKETLKMLCDKYCGISESQYEKKNTWIEDSNQEYAFNPINNANASYTDESQWEPSTETNIENISSAPFQTAITNIPERNDNQNPFDIKPVVQDDYSKNDISFNIEAANDEEPINNPLLEIEPYSKRTSNHSLDIQTSSLTQTKSIISELEEEVNNHQKPIEADKEVPSPEGEIDIIPYKEYIGNKEINIGSNFTNNNKINNFSITNNISNTMPTLPVEEKTIKQVQEPVFPFENNINKQDNIINNMMQTTDNFNTSIETYPPAANYKNMFNEQRIPIQMMQQNIPVYGQFEQNINNNVAQ